MPTRSLPPYRITATLAALWLSACGGGGDGTALTASMQQAPMAAALQPMAATTASATTAAPTYSWTLAFSTPRIWHSMSTNTDGSVIVAGEAGGPIRVSRDGG